MGAKKSCDGCRALDGYGSRLFCHLGHLIEPMPKGARGIAWEGRPAKLGCAKPRTLHDYDLAMFAAKRGIYATPAPQDRSKPL